MTDNEKNVIFLRCKQKDYDDLKQSGQVNENVIYYIEEGGVIYQGPRAYGAKFLETSNWDSITLNTFMYNKISGEIRYYYSSNDYVVINESNQYRENRTQELINNNLSWETLSSTE